MGVGGGRKVGHGGGGVLAGQWRGCWLKFCIERKHTVCSSSFKYVRCLLIPSSSGKTSRVVRLCKTVVDLHARPVGGGFFLECDYKLVLFSSIPCMVMIR